MPRLPILAWETISALGATRADLHAGLESRTCGLTTDAGLTFDTPCPVGVVTEDLPAVPAGLEALNTRCHRLALACLEQMAGPIAEVKQRYGADRVAVVAATSASGFRELEAVYTPGTLPDFDYQNRIAFGCLARFVRQATGVGGPAFTDSTACSSGANAFISAAGLLNAGLCDVAIVGGAESLCHTTYAGFRSLRVVDSEPCRPFDAARKGMSLGEGAAFFLLGREDAEPQGSSLHLAGVGASLDAYHMTAPDPDGAGSELAMRAALDDADVAPDRIGYINLHGTGTPLNDASEARGVERIFGNKVRCSSTKGHAGHLLGAASAFEIAISLEALSSGMLPCNLNLKNVDPELGLRPLQDVQRDPNLDLVMSNSFGFGGNNTAVVLEVGMMPVRILADGLVMPGVTGIPELEQRLPEPGSAVRGTTVELSDDRIPTKLRRRITRLSGMALMSTSEALERSGLPDSEAPLVWATANGEINTIGKIMDDLQGARGKVSPSQFHNSVYNAATGYWGIATGRRFPSTTVSRGELSFEYALLEAWTRLQTGTRDVLLTAGDEAVEVPQWADPAHATIDLCGSLFLSARDDRPALARILAIRHARPEGLDAIAGLEKELVEEYGASTVIRDHRVLDGPCEPELLPGSRHPCLGLYGLLHFLHSPESTGTLLQTRTDRDGDLVAIVVAKE